MDASLQAFGRLDCLLLPQSPPAGGTSLLWVLGTVLPYLKAVSNKTDSFRSSLRCRLFAVITNPLGSVRIT